MNLCQNTVANNNVYNLPKQDERLEKNVGVAVRVCMRKLIYGRNGAKKVVKRKQSIIRY